MARDSTRDQLWHDAMHAWFSLWQQQIEASMKMWGWWAQMLPHEHASDLSAEAEAMKAPAAKRARSKAA